MDLLKLFLYKVIFFAKENLSDQAEDHAASCSGTFPTAMEKRNIREEGGENKDH